MKSLSVIFFALGLGLPTCFGQEAATTAEVQEGPTIEELLKGDSFTNTAGVVMVKLSDTLWVGKYPVTQSEYKVVTGSNPSAFPGDNNPVETVSWNDARVFCAKLTEQEAQKKMLPTGFAYSIPTQAQWEFLIADATPEQAVTSIKGARKNTAPVGSLSANRLGLHDMRGNVWCWCLDPQDKTYRVLRGGAWNTSLEIDLRPEFRWFSNGPDDRRNSYGFRCVLQPK
jgi:formylglycine-generating enzyme required for sulfatase activity